MNRWKVKGWKKVHMNSKHKKAGMAILSWNKIDLKTRIITEDKQEHVIVKWSNHQKDLIINVYESNKRASIYMK